MPKAQDPQIPNYSIKTLEKLRRQMGTIIPAPEFRLKIGSVKIRGAHDGVLLIDGANAAIYIPASTADQLFTHWLRWRQNQHALRVYEDPEETATHG